MEGEEVAGDSSAAASLASYSLLSYRILHAQLWCALRLEELGSSKTADEPK